LKRAEPRVRRADRLTDILRDLACAFVGLQFVAAFDHCAPGLSRPKKRAHFSVLKSFCKVPAWFLNRQVNGNLCMIVTEN
jgi:hypothetical protein